MQETSSRKTLTMETKVENSHIYLITGEYEVKTTAVFVILWLRYVSNLKLGSNITSLTLGLGGRKSV